MSELFDHFITWRIEHYLMKVLELKSSAEIASDSTTRSLFRIVIVAYPSLLIVLGIFSKLITFNLLRMSHELRDVHILQQHNILTLYFHKVDYPIKKLVHLRPKIGYYVKSIHQELGEFESILLD